MQKSKDRPKSDDDSADELAGDSLLDNLAQEPMRSSLQSDTPASEYSKSRSDKALAEDRNKPLPPIPNIDPQGDVEHPKRTRPTLASKSTNRNILRKPALAPTRPKISYPILQASEDNDHNSALNAVYSTSETHDRQGVQTSISEAEALSRKISSLMQQAATREAEQAERLKAASMPVTTKASPLQRSKAALTKATGAIAGRFSNSGRRASTSKNTPAGSNDLRADGLLGFEYQAESGTYLGADPRPDDTTSSNNSRKPLPVYESMKSSGRSSDSLQNPFSDKNQGNPQLSPELQADFDFDFNKRKGKGKRPSEEQHSLQGISFKKDKLSALDNQSTSGFSNKISGLSQHPDTMVFSSPPLGFSTPPARLKPPTGSLHDSPSLKTAANTPSILDFSFEESDDNMSVPRDSNGFNRSLSVKRKSAKEDLRSQLSPSSKRAKKSSDDQMDLADKLRQMDTKDNGPLLEKDMNRVSSRPATADSKLKGLGNLDVAMRKGLLNGVGDKTKRPKTATRAAKRLSIPTPNSILFSRESRAHYRLRDTTDGDSGDIDELQMDEGGYKVKSVRNN